MPNIKSAKKRVLVTEKKNLINRAIVSEVKTAIRKFNNAVDTNRIDDAEKLLPETMAIIDSAAQKGAIHKNNAANKKAALSKRLSDVKSGKVSIEIKKDNKTIAAERAVATRQAREAVRAENAQKAAERAAAKETAKEAVKKGAKETPKPKNKDAAAKETTAKKASENEKKPAQSTEKKETKKKEPKAETAKEPAEAVAKPKKAAAPKKATETKEVAETKKSTKKDKPE